MNLVAAWTRFTLIVFMIMESKWRCISCESNSTSTLSSYQHWV